MNNEELEAKLDRLQDVVDELEARVEELESMAANYSGLLLTRLHRIERKLADQ